MSSFFSFSFGKGLPTTSRGFKSAKEIDRVLLKEQSSASLVKYATVYQQTEVFLAARNLS